MLSVANKLFKLSVIMLRVANKPIMLSVVAPYKYSADVFVLKVLRQGRK